MGPKKKLKPVLRVGIAVNHLYLPKRKTKSTASARQKSPKAINKHHRQDIFLEEKLSVISSKSSRASSRTSGIYDENSWHSSLGTTDFAYERHEKLSPYRVKSSLSKSSLDGRSSIHPVPIESFDREVYTGWAYTRMKRKVRERILRELEEQREICARAVQENRMLEFDDGEDFIGEVVEEVVANSLSIIYQKYIERQLLPYTISQAKEALLTIIDWRFLACDPGESDPSADPTWQEDEEPSAAVPDCWAQGSVPKTFLTARPSSVASIKEDTSSLVNEPITEESAEVDVVLDEQPKPWIVSDEQVLAEAQPNADPSQDPSKKEMSPVPPAAHKSKRRKFRPKKGRLQSAGVSNMMESLEETERRLSTEERMREVATEQNKPEPTGTFNPMPKSVGSILKFQSGRPPGSRDVYYDEHGNVVAMSRINPDKLPTHRIKTKFHVVDPSVEEAQARLDAMRTGRFNNSSSSGTKPKKPTFAVSDKAKLEKSSILDYRSVHSTHTSPRRGRGGGAHHPPKSDTSMTPLPPPMIESMELAPGVIVREGDRVKKGPRQMTRTADRLPRKDKLRPVGVEPDMSISVKELLANAGPRVRIESTPVPPIINKHGMNNVQKIST